jgi:hypothetical protein
MRLGVLAPIARDMPVWNGRQTSVNKKPPAGNKITSAQAFHPRGAQLFTIPTESPLGDSRSGARFAPNRLSLRLYFIPRGVQLMYGDSDEEDEEEVAENIGDNGQPHRGRKAVQLPGRSAGKVKQMVDSFNEDEERDEASDA